MLHGAACGSIVSRLHLPRARSFATQQLLVKSRWQKIMQSNTACAHIKKRACET